MFLYFPLTSGSYPALYPRRERRSDTVKFFSWVSVYYWLRRDKEPLQTACFYFWLLFSGCFYERPPFMVDLLTVNVCPHALICLLSLNLLPTIAAYSVLWWFFFYGSRWFVQSSLCIPRLNVIWHIKLAFSSSLSSSIQDQTQKSALITSSITDFCHIFHLLCSASDSRL